MKKMFSLIKKYEEVIRYLIVGALTTIVSLLVYYICVFAFLDPNVPLELQMANIISWICSVVFAYITNRIFVFKSKSKNIMKEILGFTSSRVLTLALDMLMMFLMVTLMSWNDKISKIIVQIIIIVLNYLLSKLFVFKKQ